MGATRKLQSEIDKVLKKVNEGVEVFDSIWNKVYDTENANQKEKFEADLKKEIKKLQRYRDQIKTWIQSSEIKDKKVAANYEQYLLDARKTIEREMERFKICEKETKTKAFSKEGLGQQPKTDPKEKAKTETREWLNNMVDELQSGIDTFESEMEGLASKKGRNRPPRLVHLEESAARHKSHVMKLELILRLLDNDELSAEQVNEIKELVEDYLERNQEDFDEFADVDEIYSQLPLEKMEAMEALDAAPSIPSSILVKEKAAVAAASGVATNGANLKPSLPAVTVAVSTSSAAAVSQASSASSPTLDDAASEERTSAIPVTGSAVSPTTSTAMQPDIASSPTATRPVATPPGLLVRTQKTVSSVVQSPSINLGKAKEDELNRRANVGDGGLSRSFGRATPSTSPAPQTPNLTLSVSSSTTSPVPGAAETAKRNLIDAAQLSSPVNTQRAFGGKLGEPTDATDAALSNRPAQWREPGQIQRPEFTPDQKQKFLQKLQQTQQANVSSLLNTPSLPHLPSPVAKQQASQSSLLQQTFLQQQQQQSPPAQMPPSPIPQAGSQSQGLSSTQQSQPQAAPVQTQQQLPLAAKDTIASQSDGVLTRNLEQRQQSPLRAKLSDEGSSETTAFTRNLSLNEDDLKNADTFDVAVQGPGTLAEFSQLSRDADFTSGQQVPSTPTSAGPGVIGRKELGAIGDNLSTPLYDHAVNLQLLEAAYRHLPQPKDSERPRSYVPRNPAMTPASYPQAPAQFIDNPNVWDKFETDVLFFSFYYQQGTYQQYLAAKELKKQSWRYHKKYNTWFQRHEEPKVTSDDFEQGTYVYFDFHIVEDLQQGWVQRIKTEFTFEYSFLEDELN